MNSISALIKNIKKPPIHFDREVTNNYYFEDKYANTIANTKNSTNNTEVTFSINASNHVFWFDH